MNWKPRTKNRGDLLKFTNKNREDPHPPEFHWLTQEGGNDVTERSEQQRWRDLWEARQITLSVRGVADDASNGRHDGLRDQRRRDDEVRRDGAQDRCEVRRRWTVTMNPKLGALKIRLLNNPKRELNDHCFGHFWFFHWLADSVPNSRVWPSQSGLHPSPPSLLQKRVYFRVDSVKCSRLSNSNELAT